MKPNLLTIAICGGLALGAGGPAAAAETGVALSDGWIRSIIPARPAAIYFTLTNSGASDRMLVRAASPACGKAMLHQSKSVDGVEKMLPVRQVAVPAHGRLAFAPGSYHVMCMSPTAAMKKGAKVPVTLSFSDGGTITAAFPVRGAVGN